jgi:hypothetical protein
MNLMLSAMLLSERSSRAASDECARHQLARLEDSAPAAMQGGHHQFGLPQRIERVLLQFLKEPGHYDYDVEDSDDYDVEDRAQALAGPWFTDKEAKKQVSEILSEFKLDESAIEAEAIRRSSSDLELLDRMLTSLESRRNKALGCIAEYRASLAHQLRESAGRIIDGKDVLQLEHPSNKRSTAA